MQNCLRDDFSITSNDLGNAIGLSPSAMTAVFKKLKIVFAASASTKIKKIPPAEVRRILESRGYVYPSVAQTKAFFVCKGGTGKTTTSYNFCVRSSSYGNRVLLIDGDPQGNATKACLKAFNYPLSPETAVLLDVLTGECSPQEAIIQISPNLHIIPSTNTNSTLENFLRNKKNAALPIRQMMKKIVADYDIVVFDCGPTLSTLNAALCASVSQIILPVNGDEFSADAINDTLNEIAQIQEDFSCEPEVKILFTRFIEKENLSKKYLGDFAEKFPHEMFETIIKQNTDLKAAISKGTDLFEFPKKCQGREDYDQFTKEVLAIRPEDLRLRSPKRRAFEMEVQ